jgi:purine nucleosidase
VLELAGAGDIEVALGCLAPLVAPLRTATGHGPTGLGYATLPKARAAVSGRVASDLLVEETVRRPGEIVLVATGPLTNVALAIRRDPKFPRRLRRLAVMGGSFEHRGNMTPAAEFNISVDPEAAKIVLDAFSVAGSRRPLICGLNVTERTELAPAHLERLAALAGGESNPVVRLVSDALRCSMESKLGEGYGYVAHMHDPLALALALDESLGVTRPGTVDVELAGPLTRGMTVVDWTGDTPNADVTTDADFERFLDELIERIGELARG